jgi:hypothetical protein
MSYSFPRYRNEEGKAKKAVLDSPTFVVAIWNEIPAGNSGQRRLAYLIDRMNPKGTANIWGYWRSDASQFYTRISANAALKAITLDHVRAQAKVYPNLEVHVLTGGILGKELT